MSPTAKRIESSARRRRILILAMGGKCEYCGTTENIEFHHLERRTWTTRTKPLWQRIALYELEFEEGKLKLACGTCNKRMGQPSDPYTDEVPF